MLLSHFRVLCCRGVSRNAKHVLCLMDGPYWHPKTCRNPKATRLPLGLQDNYCQLPLTLQRVLCSFQSSSSLGKQVANIWDLTWSKMLLWLENSTTSMQADLYSCRTNTYILFWICSCLNFIYQIKAVVNFWVILHFFIMVMGFKLIFLLVTGSSWYKVSQQVLRQAPTMLLELLLILSSHRIYKVYSLIKYVNCLLVQQA